MDKSLENRVAVVTGSGAGLGQTVAERYAREGAKVIIAEIDPASGAQVAEDIQRQHGDAVFFRTDVGEESDVQALAEFIRTRHGRVDVLYNNAAVLDHSLDARAHELTTEIWDRTMRVNLRGLWLCSKYLIPLMMSGAGASIIHVGSPTALNSSGSRLTAYSASKGGVLAMTKVMAIDYAQDGIRVNCIIPGTMDTPMNAKFFEDETVRQRFLARIPLGRLGSCEDITGLAVFLASDESRYCTGGVYLCDGGFTSF